MSKEGIPIEPFDPKPAIKKNAEAARDWEYSEEAQYLYGMAILFKDRFLDPILLTDRGRLPDPVISFDNRRNRKVLASYTLHRNPQGLLDEITFNTAHYKDEAGKKVWVYGKWVQLETLLHEQVHLWQQNFGQEPVRPGRVYHNKEFVEKCESLGLHPLPVVGCHTEVADGVFAQLMNELGIERPNDVPTDAGIEWTKSGGVRKDWFRPKREKGKSTLEKWVCPDCGLAVRLGIKSDPHLVHDVCTEIKGEKVFLIRHDGLSHTIYDGKSADGRILGCDKPNYEVELLRAIDQGNLLNEAVTTATSYVSFKVTRTTKVLDLSPMKERDPNQIVQIEKDDALMNFVNRQAQEAILNPTLPDSYKDEVLEAAIETIHRVAESRAIYFAKHGEGRRKKLKSKT